MEERRAELPAHFSFSLSSVSPKPSHCRNCSLDQSIPLSRDSRSWAQPCISLLGCVRVFRTHQRVAVLRGSKVAVRTVESKMTRMGESREKLTEAIPEL